MMAFSHFPVAPTKLTIPAEVGLNMKLMMMMYRKVQRETLRVTAVIFWKSETEEITRIIL